MWLYVSIKIRLSHHHVKGGTITVVERPVVAVSLLIVHCLQGVSTLFELLFQHAPSQLLFLDFSDRLG